MSYVDTSPAALRALADELWRYAPVGTTPQATLALRAIAAEKEAAPDVLTALRYLLYAHSRPDEIICCDGRDCSCRGITTWGDAEHHARVTIAKAEGKL